MNDVMLKNNERQSKYQQLEQQFKFSKNDLIKIVKAAQNRIIAEEIDDLEIIGGLNAIEQGLQTNFTIGLNEADFKEREAIFGNNKKTIIPVKTFLHILTQTYMNFLLDIQIITFIIAIFIGAGIIQGVVIVIMLFVYVNLLTFKQYKQEKNIEKLRTLQYISKTVTVWRNGIKQNLHQDLLMVGDIIQIFEGMDIPADCLVIEGFELLIDESAISGETQPIKKDTYEKCKQQKEKLKNQSNICKKYQVPSPVLLSGTQVLSGEGKMIVIVVGDESCQGKIKKQLEKEVQQIIPFQEKLNLIRINIYIFISAIILFIALLLRIMIERYAVNISQQSLKDEILNIFVISLTIVVLAFPSGIFYIISIFIYYISRYMIQSQILIRNLNVFKIIDSVDTLSINKKILFRQDKLSLSEIWNDITQNIDSYQQTLSLNNFFPQDQDLQELFIQSTIVNSFAITRPYSNGSKIELSLIAFFEKCQISYEKERVTHQSTMNIPFSNNRQRRSTIIQNKRLVINGDSDIILQCCSKFHSKSKGIIDMDQNVKQNIENAIVNMQQEGIQTIGLAYKELSGLEDLTTKDENGVYDIEKSNLIFIGILGLKDLIHSITRDSISKFKKAGINIIMISENTKISADNLALECGIVEQQENYLVMEGTEFIQQIGGLVCNQCQLSNCNCPKRVDIIKEQIIFDQLYPSLKILAKSREEDKLALVLAQQFIGHTVAFTEGNRNDILALKKADLSFSLGISGTELARDNCSIILLDDSIDTILKTVMWGRHFYDLIQKFLQLQLTLNLTATITTIISSIFVKQETIRPLQMAWIILIIDIFATFTLIEIGPSQKILQRMPRKRSESIISPKMLKHIIGQTIYQITIILILLFSSQTFIPEYEGVEDGQQPFLNNLQFKYSDTYFNEQLQLHTCPDYENFCKLIQQNTNYNLNGSQNYQQFYNEQQISSRQFTIIFNTFVMMQLFNLINISKNEKEFNIFAQIRQHIRLPISFIGILSLQIILVTFSGNIFNCYSYYGLRIQQWAICFAFGFGGLIIKPILSFIPDPNFLF